MPYGNKSKADIIAFANRIINYLETYNVKAILLACNTVSAEKHLLTCKTPLFGIITAGCHAALAEDIKYKKVGLIATVATVNSGVYESTMSKINPDIELVTNDSRKLPKIINNQLDHKYLLDKHIRECIDPIVEKDGHIDKLILGCSHFPIIQDEIQHIYPDLSLIDPATEQVGALKAYLAEHDLLKNAEKVKTDIYATADLSEFEQAVNRLKIQPDSITLLENF
jgi:glutamate racemase